MWFQTTGIRKGWEERGGMTTQIISRQPISGAMKKKDQPEWTDGPSAIFYSINLNISSLMPHECAICVPLLRAKEETLWLAKLDRSSHEATADGSSGSISVAITKPRNAIPTTEPSAARCGKRKHI